MITLSRKGNLIAGIVALVTALCMFVGAFCLVHFCNNDEIYEKAYVFERWETLTVGKGGRQYLIYVEEESEPLLLASIALKYADTTALENMQRGDNLQCTVKDNSRYVYEIVGLCVNGQCVLTLADFYKANLQNSIVGCCLCGILGILMTVMSGILLYRAQYGYSARYKNAEKKNLKKILLQQAKQGEISQEDTEQMIAMLDSIDMSDDLPCDKNELTEKISNSFFTSKNREYTTVGELMENQGCFKVLRETLKKILADNELRVCYDAGLTDDSGIYLMYKINGKIIDGYLLKNDETDKFEINNLNMSSDLYERTRLSKSEKAQLVERLREYNRTREDIFDIDRSLM